MKKINALLLSLFSFNYLFSVDIIYELNEIHRLEKQARAQYIGVWFGLGITSLLVAKFLGERAQAFESELKDKWFWNPQTQQEELPAEVDQTTGTLYYWGGKTAIVTGCLSLIWGVKQALYIGAIRALIKVKEKHIEEQRQSDEGERQRQRQQQENDPGFRHWKETNPFGKYDTYLLEETFRREREARDPEFKQWRRANPGGSHDEYQKSRRTGGSSPQPPLRSHYEILGIQPNATAAQIKKAYHTLAREYHPSTNSSARDLDETERLRREAVFKEITDAWNTFQDPVLKKAYDNGWGLTEDQRRMNVTLAIREKGDKNQKEAEAEAKLKAEREAREAKRNR